jgi:hypothetical protein
VGDENDNRGEMPRSDPPSVPEPWFLSLNASIETQACMTPDDQKETTATQRRAGPPTYEGDLG